MNAWELVKRQLETKLSPESFQNWVSKTAFSRIESRTLWVSVPNSETRAWMESEYAELVRSIVRSTNLGVEVDQVAFELPLTDRMQLVHEREAGTKDIAFNGVATQLNPKFSFDTFVEGACNQFAHAAARSVAVNPSHSYNPLLIYGGVGMGKTHLMHAIGRSLSDNFGGMKIVYTSSERFMNEMIACLRLDRMPHFHSYYRSADVLLIDDIQIIGGKERT